MARMGVGRIVGKAASIVAARSQARPASKLVSWLGVGLLAGASLGISPALSAERGQPVSVHTAASVAKLSMQWVEAAPFVMIEAGRNVDGSIDLRKMMEAWRDAGMDVSGLPDALDLVSEMMPMVASASDLVVIEDRKQKMEQARTKLQSLYPGVVKNLQDAAPAVRLDQDTRVSWDFAIDRYEYLVSHDLDLDTSIPMEYRSLQNQVEGLRRWNKSSDVQVGEPHVLSFGNLEDGSFSVHRLVDVMRRSGMSPDKAKEMLDELFDLTLPLDNAPRLSAIHRNYDADNFNYFAGAKYDAEGTLRLAHKDPGFSAPQRGTNQQWEDLASGFLRHPQPGKAKVSMRQARLEIEQASREVGLRSFMPSLWQMRSAGALSEAAQRLVQANDDLSAATGWSGKVLGLNGRIELRMRGSPLHEDREDSGHAAFVEVGRVDRISMVSYFSVMAHEWYHAYDLVSGQLSLGYHSPILMSDNARFFNATGNREVKQAFAQLNKALKSAASEWHEHRQRADRGLGREYYTSNTEAGAYAFAALVSRGGAKVTKFDPEKMFKSMVNVAAPSAREGAMLAPYFQNAFNATRALVMGSPHPASVAIEATDDHAMGTQAISSAPPGMKSIALWREERAQSSGSNLSPLRPPANHRL